VAKFRVIAMTALQETLRKKVSYLVFLLLVIVLIAISSQLLFLRMASHAGETRVVEQVRASFVMSVVHTWTAAAFFLALFLGSVGLSSEIAARTIVSVLTRPVDRGVYLLARWCGILAFLWAFLVVGIAGAVLVAAFFHVHYAPVFWFGVAELFVQTLFFSGIALALSVWMPPVLAGSCALFIPMVLGWAGGMTNNPHLAVRILAVCSYYLAPAQLAVNFFGQSVSRELLHPEYGLYVRVLAENAMYAAAVFLIAAASFRRRELRVRS
jgi:ABC-type transport system involved in multi-copper enzyme maturation permease subunit